MPKAQVLHPGTSQVLCCIIFKNIETVKIADDFKSIMQDSHFSSFHTEEIYWMKGEIIKSNTGAFLLSGKGSCCQLVWITAASQAYVLQCALTLSTSTLTSWIVAGVVGVHVCKSFTSELLTSPTVVAAWTFSSSVRSTPKKQV